MTSWPAETTGEVREKETEAVPGSVTGGGPYRAKAKTTAPKTGPAPGNAHGIARAMGRDRAVVLEMVPVRTMVPAVKETGANNNSEGTLSNPEMHSLKDK